MPSDDLKRRLNPPLLTIGAAFLILTIVVAALAMGRPFLLPLVLALVVWYVIASLRDFMANIRLGGFQLPRWVSLLLSMLVIGSIAYFVINIVLASFAALVGDFPKYVSDANRLLELVQGLLPEGLTLDINLQNQFDRILGIANNFAGQLRLVTQNIVIIVIYVAFMLVEDQRFNAKLKHLFPNRDDYARAQQVLGAIGKKIQAYLAVKTLMSLITADPRLYHSAGVRHQLRAGLGDAGVFPQLHSCGRVDHRGYPAHGDGGSPILGNQPVGDFCRYRVADRCAAVCWLLP